MRDVVITVVAEVEDDVTNEEIENETVRSARR